MEQETEGNIPVGPYYCPFCQYVEVEKEKEDE